jgi:hypothetical protein
VALARTDWKIGCQILQVASFHPGNQTIALSNPLKSATMSNSEFYFQISLDPKAKDQLVQNKYKLYIAKLGNKNKINTPESKYLFQQDLSSQSRVAS